MQFAQLLHLKEAGLPIPDSVIIEAATIQNKKDLIETIENQAKQEQEAQQMQQQLELQQVQANIELAKAKTVADQGLGVERVSRVEENKALAVERRAEAQKDRAQGLLNLVKTMQEIDDIDLTQLEKLISISRMLSEKEEARNVKEGGKGLQSIAGAMKRAQASTSQTSELG